MTYCFRVENTGDFYLANVTITDTDVTPNLSTNIGVLAPGQIAWGPPRDQIDGDLVNTADVVGTPADSNGMPVVTNTVTDMDPAEVDEINPVHRPRQDGLSGPRQRRFLPWRRAGS